MSLPDLNACLATLAVAIVLVFPGHGLAQSSPAARPIGYTPEERFLADVVGLRSLAIERPDIARPRFTGVFVAGDSRVFKTEYADALWRHFFAGSIVRIGRAKSERPMSLYYNPVLDVGLVVTWSMAAPTRYAPVSLDFLPGEQLSKPGPAAAGAPMWQTADDPVDALARLAKERLASFAHQHPAPSTDVSSQRADRGSYARSASGRVLAAMNSLKVFASEPLQKAYGTYATRLNGDSRRNLRPVMTHGPQRGLLTVFSIEASNPRHLEIAAFAYSGDDQVKLVRSGQVAL
jgi:hypothetical protein